MTGANSHATVEAPVWINDTTGSSSFIIDPNLIVNTGSQSLSIIFVTSHDLGDCGAAVPSNQIVFEIEPIPNVENLSLLADDICFGYDAIIDVQADSLADGNYMAICELVGANSYAIDTLPLNMISGTGEIVLASDSLIKPGVSTFTLHEVAFITGESCAANVNVSVGFALYPDPGSTSLLLSVNDICVGSNATAAISSIFPDGDYVFVYTLTGANQENSIHDTISFSSNDGTANITVPSSSLDSSGTQVITITEIQVLGVNACTSSGLSIADTFGIEGVVVVDSIIASESLCQGNSQSIMVYGLNEGTGNLSYQWYGSQNGSFMQLSDQGVYTGTSSDMLVVSNNTGLNGYEYFCSIGTNQCAGISSDTILFNVLSGSVCGEGLEDLPNAISPNGDGVNDVWVIDGIQNYPGNKVQIFNRWGTLVFEAENYNNSSVVFDGRGNVGIGANGEVTDGTFFFVIDLGDGSTVQKGYLVVNR